MFGKPGGAAQVHSGEPCAPALAGAGEHAEHQERGDDVGHSQADQEGGPSPALPSSPVSDGREDDKEARGHSQAEQEGGPSPTLPSSPSESRPDDKEAAGHGQADKEGPSPTLPSSPVCESRDDDKEAGDSSAAKEAADETAVGEPAEDHASSKQVGLEDVSSQVLRPESPNAMQSHADHSGGDLASPTLPAPASESEGEDREASDARAAKEGDEQTNPETQEAGLVTAEELGLSDGSSPTAEELSLGDGSLRDLEEPAPCAECAEDLVTDGDINSAKQRGEGDSPEEPDMQASDSSDAPAAKEAGEAASVASAASGEAQETDHPTAEELGLDSSYSQAEGLSLGNSLRDSKEFGHDAEDPWAVHVNTAQSASLPRSLASDAEEVGTESSDAPAAKDAAGEAASGQAQEVEDHQPTVEELGLGDDSSRDSSEPTLQEEAAAGSVAEEQQEAEPVPSDYDGSYAEESEDEDGKSSRSSRSGPQSGGVSEDIPEVERPSVVHSMSSEPLHRSISEHTWESQDARTLQPRGEEPKGVESSRFLLPEEVSVLESGFSGQWSELEAGPRHVSKELSEDAYSGEWSEEEES